MVEEATVKQETPVTKYPYWVVMQSRTGSTATEVAKRLDRKPSIILDTNKNSPNDIYNYIRKNINPQKTIITLMGFMRIVPADICEKFNIVNLHPAPIHMKSYEFLKGKDPIEKYFCYLEDRNVVDFSSSVSVIYGSVLHKATAELDGGEIIDNSMYLCSGKEDCYEKSFTHNTSMWVRYLTDVLI